MWKLQNKTEYNFNFFSMDTGVIKYYTFRHELTYRKQLSKIQIC